METNENNSISHLMIPDHRKCDNLYAELEEAVVAKKWSETKELLTKFTNSMESHLKAEEELIFPEFEAKTGQTQGPTYVMKMEHQQMRDIMQRLMSSMDDKSYDEVAGFMETLMILMQQHNMKEEQMLYVMTDQVLAESLDKIVPELLKRINS